MPRVAVRASIFVGLATRIGESRGGTARASRYAGLPGIDLPDLACCGLAWRVRPGAEITDALTELLELTPEQLAVTYDGRPKSVLIDRMEWARSYAKLSGALDSPRRGLFVLSNLGKRILSLPEEEGRAQVAQLDRDVRAARRRRGPAGVDLAQPDEGETSIGASGGDGDAGEDGAWREVLLARLHRLNPAGFEEFALYLLRTFGLELTRVGGVGDEGIDGIGLAPISAVLSSRVAVQAKRY